MGMAEKIPFNIVYFCCTIKLDVTQHYWPVLKSYKVILANNFRMDFEPVLLEIEVAVVPACQGHTPRKQRNSYEIFLIAILKRKNGPIFSQQGHWKRRKR